MIWSNRNVICWRALYQPSAITHRVHTTILIKNSLTSWASQNCNTWDGNTYPKVKVGQFIVITRKHHRHRHQITFTLPTLPLSAAHCYNVPSQNLHACTHTHAQCEHGVSFLLIVGISHITGSANEICRLHTLKLFSACFRLHRGHELYWAVQALEAVTGAVTAAL